MVPFSRRRLVLCAAVLLLPANVQGQRAQKQPARIGFLSPGTGKTDLPMFRQGMRELGYAEGQDMSIEFHPAQGDPRVLRRLASELVASRVDIIVTVGAGIRAVHDLTRTIPIVARATDDPVEAGFARSLAHPGGNITGVTSISARLNAKRLELLRDVLPNIARVGVVWNPQSGPSADYFKEMQTAAKLLKVELVSLPLTAKSEVFTVLRLAVEKKVGAITMIRTPLIQSSQEEIVRHTLAQRLPAIFDDSAPVNAGGLMSYGANLDQLHRRLAYYVDRILKGAKPADLPIEQPTEFELAVNLKSARALGITVPPAIMVRADRVIG